MLRWLLRAFVASLWSCAVGTASAAPSLNPDVTPPDDRLYHLRVGLHGNGQSRDRLYDRSQAEAAAIGRPRCVSEYELDHIVPLALGGHPRALDNLQLQP